MVPVRAPAEAVADVEAGTETDTAPSEGPDLELTAENIPSIATMTGGKTFRNSLFISIEHALCLLLM